jgi:hypothetical protein
MESTRIAAKTGRVQKRPSAVCFERFPVPGGFKKSSQILNSDDAELTAKMLPC